MAEQIEYTLGQGVVVTCFRLNGRHSLMLNGEQGAYAYDTPLEAVHMLLQHFGWETVIYPEDGKLCIIGRLPQAKPPVKRRMTNEEAFQAWQEKKGQR